MPHQTTTIIQELEINSFLLHPRNVSLQSDQLLCRARWFVCIRLYVGSLYNDEWQLAEHKVSPCGGNVDHLL